MKSRKLTIMIFTTILLFFIILVGLLYTHILSDTEKLISDNLCSVDIVKKLHIPNLKWKEIFVQKCSTLTTIFTRLHLKINQNNLLELDKQHKPFTTFSLNKILYSQVKPLHQLIVTFKYSSSSTKASMAKHKCNHFINKIDQKPITTTLSYKSVMIQHSLSQDGKKSGLTYRMQKELQSIFGSQINFSHDMHYGDHFEFLYQVESSDDKKDCGGNIIVAEFNHHGKTYQAIRYTYPISHTAYYTPEGYEIRAQFLHTPLHYTRISSYFSYHRLDPILHIVRPHLGLDFAAPQGTPIKSIGEGQVVFIGRDGGYGKTVKIRYSQRYLALYAHLSCFAKIKAHQWVHKGQIIGEVGESGWATGPHLHFGFFINGKAKNWLAIKLLPTDQSVPRSYISSFHKEVRQLLTELRLHQDTELVANTNNIKHPS